MAASKNSSNTSKSTTLKTLRFEDGAVQFRQRLVVSILSHRPCLIQNIRHESTLAPGLRRHEVSFLRLLDSLTNGTRIEINATGTQVRFQPGILTGGRIQHECPVLSAEEAEEDAMDDNNDDDDDEVCKSSSRSIGWFLEGILPLAPFGKEALHVEFTGGITDGTCHMDPSCDYLQSSILPLMSKFGIGSDGSSASDGINNQDFSNDQSKPYIRILQRAGAPYGNAGKVQFYSPVLRKELKSVDLVDAGKIQRIRGTAISCQLTSSSATARVAYCSKGVLLRLLPDVWIHTNVHKLKHDKNASSAEAQQPTSNPSLSLVLTAQSTTGVVLTSEVCLPPAKPGVVARNNNLSSSSEPQQEQRRESFEDLGTRGAVTLLEEIKRGGCVDTSAQSLCFLWMALSPEICVSRIRVGTLSQYAIATLRLIKQALGVEFKIQPDYDSKTVLLSCLGIGYRNMARAST